jgi:hypothetical protein
MIAIIINIMESEAGLHSGVRHLYWRILYDA